MRSGWLGLCVLAVTLGACTETPPPHPKSGSLASALTVSARSARVPRDLLVAIAKVEDGLEVPRTRPIATIDVDATVPAAGPLQLRRGKLDTLRRGAELANASESDLRADADLALEAGARVLAELATKTNATPADLASYSLALEEMSGFADPPHRERYAHRVFATLARGGSFRARDGETVTLPAHPELPPALTADLDLSVHPLATAEYPGAEWIPTSCKNKCTLGRGSFKVEMVVIHDTEGGWNASVATLQNDPNKSVQYIIGVDGAVAQFVTEDTTAWHAGNFNFNQRSVGIEHVGYATKPFPEALYASSAKLVDYLTTKYSVPKDRAHIIGHDQVPNGTRIEATSPPCSSSPKECAANTDYGGASHHTDPGVWEWPTFMARFGGEAKCNDATSFWACSFDNSKAFRCANDTIQITTCVGPCEAAAATADATCSVAPSAEPVVVPPKDESSPPADSGCSLPPRLSREGRLTELGWWPAAVAVIFALRRRRDRHPS